MDELEADLSDHIRFLWLDVEDPATLPLREQYNVVRRTRYSFVDADGNILRSWIGYLDEVELSQYLREWAAAQS